MPTENRNERKCYPWKDYRKTGDNVTESEGYTYLDDIWSRIYGSVPNWRTRISRSQSATGLLSVNVTRFQIDRFEHASYKGATGISTVKYRSGPISKPMIGFPAITDPGYADAVQGAQSAWSRKLRSVNTGVQAGVTLGEARESISMLKGRTTQMASMIGSYFKDTVTLRKRHGIKRSGGHTNRRRIGSYLQDQNGLYLEYSYGWAPLISEVEAWSEELQRNPFRGYQNVQNLMSKCTIPYVKGDRVVLAHGINSCPLYWHREYRLEKSIKYYGAVLLQTAEAQRLQGLGLKPHEFAPTIWELIPWSFVVDYFTNVGLVIQALSQASTRLAWSQTTEVTTQQVVYHTPEYMRQGVYSSCYGYIKASLGSEIADSYKYSFTGRMQRDSTTISRLGGTPQDMVPKLEFRSPSEYQAFNVLALLTSKYRAFQRFL